MTTPTTFPVWMLSSTPGSEKLFVTDIYGYNAAVGNGYTCPATPTPGGASAGSTTTPTGKNDVYGGVTHTVVYTQVSPGQLDTTFDQISHGIRK
jgi:hypothetical protein